MSERMDALLAGKLPPALLAALLGEVPAPPSQVIIGAQPGEDAAVVDIGGRYLVLASDPVTFSANPGIFAVHVNANDIAVMGAEPRWFLASVLLPAGSTEATARTVMQDIVRGCTQLGVALIGGHTEVTPSVTHPVVVGTMIGEVSPDRLITSGGARPGDAILLAGPLAVEGTAILAREHAPELKRRGVVAEVIREGAGLLDDPGISVLLAARTLMAVTRPHAMHDATEGGLFSAVREMVDASGMGLRLQHGHVPIFPSCHAICDGLGLEPLALLASGSLLAALDPADVPRALSALSALDIKAAAIGEILPPQMGMLMTHGRGEVPLPVVRRDELARWIERA